MQISFATIFFVNRREFYRFFSVSRERVRQELTETYVNQVDQEENEENAEKK